MPYSFSLLVNNFIICKYSFQSILNYMRTRKLHLPAYVCGPAVKHEFEFWGLSPKKIEQCCWMSYNEWNVTHRALQRLERDRKVSLQSRDTCTEDNVQWNDKSWWSKKWQCKVWRFLNRPKSSHGAKVISGYFCITASLLFKQCNILNTFTLLLAEF